MKRVSKAILIILGVLVMLAAGAIFGVNRYLQSPAAKQRLQAEISHAIGLPLEITTLNAGWGGVKVAGVRVPSEGGVNLLEADSFSAEFAMLPLLGRRLEVKRVTLEAPKIVWAQNDKGKWILPILPEHGTKEKLPNGDQPKPAAAKGQAFSLALDRLEIHHGSLELLDKEGKRVLLATELEVTQSLKNPKQVEGTIAAQRIWSSWVTFSEVSSPITYSDGELKLTDLRGKNGSGTAHGTATIQTEVKETPFGIDLQLDKLELARLATDAGWPGNLVSGTTSGTFQMTGLFGDSEKNRGKGQISISEGRLAQMELFATIGQILQIPELTDLKVRTGRAQFHFEDDKTYIDDLLLETPDLRIGTKGNIRYDGKMKLAAELGVSERLAKQLPTFVRTNFGALDAQHMQSITFNVSGMTDHPETDLLKRVIGQQVGGQFEDILSMFKKPEKDKDKDKDAEKEEKKRKKEERKKAEAAVAAEAAAKQAGSTTMPPPAPAPVVPAPVPTQNP